MVLYSAILFLPIYKILSLAQLVEKISDTDFIEGKPKNKLEIKI